MSFYIGFVYLSLSYFLRGFLHGIEKSRNYRKTQLKKESQRFPFYPLFFIYRKIVTMLCRGDGLFSFLFSSKQKTQGKNHKED